MMLYKKSATSCRYGYHENDTILSGIPIPIKIHGAYLRRIIVGSHGWIFSFRALINLRCDLMWRWMILENYGHSMLPSAPPAMVEVINYGIELIGVCHLHFGSLWRRKNKGAQDFPLATVLRRTIWRVAKHTQSSLENWFGENNLNSHFHVACRSSHTSKQRLEVDDRRPTMTTMIEHGTMIWLW